MAPWLCQEDTSSSCAMRNIPVWIFIVQPQNAGSNSSDVGDVEKQYHGPTVDFSSCGVHCSQVIYIIVSTAFGSIVMEDYFLLVPRASVVAWWCSVHIANTALPGLGTNNTRVSWSFNPNNSRRSHLPSSPQEHEVCCYGLYQHMLFDLQVLLAAMQDQ